MIKQKLYVLDDDIKYAELLGELAATAGWEAICQNNPASFLESELPQGGILVLDLNMPEMDGVEVIRALAAKKLDLLLILISGFDTQVLHSTQQLAEAHNFNVIASLAKPITINEFTDVLNKTKETIKLSKESSIQETTLAVKDIETAILQHQLILHYQPQINIKSGKIEGVEALVRWNHPELGLLLPEQFIQLAENNNLIDQLTKEVLALAIHQNKMWKSEGLSIPISINVSAQNITSLSLPEQLKMLTDKHAVTAKDITIELTESAVMTELTSSLDVLNRLRMKGFSLSIDDFGTGYSSLTHLYQAPFTELKIDRRFVMNMIDDKQALVIVKICIMLGKMLGMKLVAEGIETEKIYNELRKLDCDIAQGYFIAKPMPAKELTLWVKSRVSQYIAKSK